MFIWRTTFCFPAPWRWKRKPAMVSQTENEWGGAISGAALRSRRLRLGHVHPCTLPRRFRLRPRATYFSPLPQSRCPAGARRSEFCTPGPAILPHVAGATRALPPLDFSNSYEAQRVGGGGAALPPPPNWLLAAGEGQRGGGEGEARPQGQRCRSTGLGGGLDRRCAVGGAARGRHEGIRLDRRGHRR